jgi:deazaflavin-dependent oxidoreductase (nitroreductase family)
MHYQKIPWWQRIIQRLAMIEVISSGFLSKYLHHIDTAVLNKTQGRKSLATMLSGLPVVVVSTVGARSGKTRTIPLGGIPIGENIILIASWFGNPSYPAWYYNLRTNPEVTVSQDGKSRQYIARLTEGSERQDCWQLAVHYYPGYQSYEGRTAGREIPIFILEPAV